MLTTPTKVVFLIDEQSLMNEQTSLVQIKLLVMRTLLYYHTQRSSDVQWSYRFFSTQTKYPLNSMRYFTTITPDSLESIELEYTKRDKERPKNQASLGTPIMRIKQVLKEALGDFPWENTDLSANTTKKYMYLLTECPDTMEKLHPFFMTTDNPPTAAFAYVPYFKQLKKELEDTLLSSYNQHQIKISIIDSSQHVPLSNPYEQYTNRMIQQGFESCVHQFGGKFISLASFIRNYGVYGHSFKSEFNNILPHDVDLDREQTQLPVWKGPFRSKLGKMIGRFVLCASHTCSTLHPSLLAFISEIRTVDIVHSSQFSGSWLLKHDTNESDHDYKFTFEPGESSLLLDTLLDELYDKQQIIIAELIPMVGYEEHARKVCIEPFSRSTASLRFLNMQIFPSTVRLKQVAMDENYPIGTFLQMSKTCIKWPDLYTLSDTETTLPLAYEATFIKKLIQSKHMADKRLKQKPLPLSSILEKKKERPMPTSVNMLSKSLKKLYWELLYTQAETVENALAFINQWIVYLLNQDEKKEDIIDVLQKLTMPINDLEQKYRERITEATIRERVHNQLEKSYLLEWWMQIRNKNGADSRFIQTCYTVLRLKEARIQVILYCFIARLMGNDTPLSCNPVEMAQLFFKKTVLAYTLHNITEFLEEMDNDDGLEATRRRDPADLHDYVLMQQLQKCFTDLPELTATFKEIVGMDDMDDIDVDISPISPIDIEDPFEEKPLPPIYKQKVERPTTTKRSQSDTIVRGYHRPPAKDIRKSRPLLPIDPVKITRSSSNKMFDSMLKRTIHVPQSSTSNNENTRGEATQEAMAKIHRSTVNGRATLKRAGSFIKSAQSPKRNRISNTETGTVVMRRERLPQPQVTPRTSLSRHLGTNITAEYAEICPSPSSKDGDLLSQGSTKLEYLQGSPSSTPHRYRKVMMNHTPHRSQDDDDDEFSILQQADEPSPQSRPFTPRTAARRAKDKIPMESNHQGRNLITMFQDIYEEDKKQSRTISTKSNIFADDDDEEEEEENQASNPFFTSAGSESPTTRPIMRRAKTLDIFDESLDFPGIGFPHLEFSGTMGESDSD